MGCFCFHNVPYGARAAEDCDMSGLAGTFGEVVSDRVETSEIVSQTQVNVFDALLFKE